MNLKERMPAAAVLITAAAVPIGVVCRTIAYLNHFDKELGYFDTCAASVIDTVLCFAVVLLLITCALLTPKNTLPTELPESRTDRLAAFAPTAGFLIFIFMSLPLFGELQAVRLNPNGTGLQLKTALPILLVFAVGGAVYGLVTMFGWKNNDCKAGLGFFPILWGLLVVAITYMDQYVAMNSPVKLGIMFGALGMMLALTAELRYLFGKPAPRTYPVLVGCGAFFCLNGCLPYLIAYPAGAVKANTLYVLFSLVFVMMGLYFVIRLIRFLGLTLPRKEATDSCA